MTQLDTLVTNDDRIDALERMFKNARVELVTLIEALDLHRNVLKSPKERITEIEKQAAESLKVVKHLDARLKAVKNAPITET